LEFDHLEEINNLVFHVWDAAVLRCLLVTSRPMRYSDVGSAVDQWSQRRRPSDSDLTRSLDRLRKAGFVHRTDAGNRRSRIYTLTSSGRERASKIGALIGVLESSDLEDELTRAQHADGTSTDGQGGDGLAE
jgi:DNA-binding PadR family transcriptional regulator